tara:strand:- start:715 stop:1866 length:1152 start_codon:yes stop_codon:yes gene_type:complete
MELQDFDYHLPSELIAQKPSTKRSNSKLVYKLNENYQSTRFLKLPDLLQKNSNIVFNKTKVIKARIQTKLTTGSQIEFFLLRPKNQTFDEALNTQKSTFWYCLIGNKKKLKNNRKLVLSNTALECIISIESFEENLVKIEWNTEQSFLELLQVIGNIPLPPYINRLTESTDLERYQTVFGEKFGSVAAPTASLHFDKKLLGNIKNSFATSYVNLHVGLGTFKPVSNENVRDHHMHEESFDLKTSDLENLINNKNIVAIGTTVLRLVESLYWIGLKKNKENFHLQQYENESIEDKGGGLEKLLNYCLKKNIKEIEGKTSLYILPGYDFRIAKQLITNFHMPKSSLLFLVDAFTKGQWRRQYQYAIDNKLRFYSYGDANLFNLAC